MKKNTVYLYFLLIITCCLSCRKDVDRKLVGTYKGTARYTYQKPSTTVYEKDTLYTDVIITVNEGTESTRKQTFITLTFSQPGILPAYNENMNIDNGVVNFMRTNRGAAGSYYTWDGKITLDSLNLINKNLQGNGSVWQWDFKAKRQ